MKHATVCAIGLALLATGLTSAQVFSNRELISILDGRAAFPYPSSIAVFGITDPLVSVTATIVKLTHTSPGDIDILLVGPTGITLMLMSDNGDGADVVDITLTFADGAPPLPTVLVSGTFSPPSAAQFDPMPAPAPVGPYGTTFAPYLAANPNGTWNLFVVDDAGVDVGDIEGGWFLTFTTSAVPEPTTMILGGLGIGGAILAGRRKLLRCRKAKK